MLLLGTEGNLAATVPGKRYAICITMPTRRRNSRGAMS